MRVVHKKMKQQRCPSWVLLGNIREKEKSMAECHHKKFIPYGVDWVTVPPRRDFDFDLILMERIHD
jgi:hypothetical protein